MHKNVGILIGALAIVTIGSGIFFATKKSPAPVVATQSKTTISKSAPSNQPMEGTIKDLLTNGKSLKCTYTNKVQPPVVTGTMYIADSKVRGDFTSVANGQTVNGHMIVVSGNYYIWTDLSNQGIKMALNTMQPTGAPTKARNVNINQVLSYSCQNWTADNTLFTLPATITFTASGAPAAGISVTPVSGGNSQSMCAACNNIPAGPAQMACKSQLHCN